MDSASLSITCQHVCAGVSLSHSPTDPPVIIAHSDVEVSRTTFSAKGDSRGGGFVLLMYFPEK